jgi:hypothetical protein
MRKTIGPAFLWRRLALYLRLARNLHRFSPSPLARHLTKWPIMPGRKRGTAPGWRRVTATSSRKPQTRSRSLPVSFSPGRTEPVRRAASLREVSGERTARRPRPAIDLRNAICPGLSARRPTLQSADDRRPARPGSEDRGGRPRDRRASRGRAALRGWKDRSHGATAQRVRRGLLRSHSPGSRVLGLVSRVCWVS